MIQCSLGGSVRGKPAIQVERSSMSLHFFVPVLNSKLGRRRRITGHKYHSADGDAGLDQVLSDNNRTDRIGGQVIRQISKGTREFQYNQPAEKSIMEHVSVALYIIRMLMVRMDIRVLTFGYLINPVWSTT